MHWMNTAILVPVGLLLGMQACKKDADENPPTVRIVQVTPSGAIHIPASVAVTIEVADDQVVKAVTLALEDENGVTVGPLVSGSVNESGSSLTLTLAITDERLGTGNYVLAARATDGTNDGRDFEPIDLVAAPLRVLAVLASPAPDPGGGAIMWLDTNEDWTTWSGPEDVHEMAVIGRTVISSGATDGDLVMRHYDGSDRRVLAVNEGLAGSNVPYFSGLRSDPTVGRIHVGLANGLIRGFNGSGTGVFTGTSPEGLRSACTVVLEDRLMSGGQHIGTDQWSLVAHAGVGGGVIEQRPMDHVPFALAKRTPSQVLSFGQRGPDVIIHSFPVLQLGGSDLLVLTDTQLHDVESDGAGYHALGLSTGLTLYSAASNTIDVLYSAGAVNAAAFDPANGSIYAASGSLVMRIDRASGAILDSWTLPIIVGDLAVVLNR
jgi:hypothetical protein